MRRSTTDRPTAGYDANPFAAPDVVESFSLKGWEKFPIFINFCRDLGLNPDGTWTILRTFRELRRDLDVRRDADSFLYTASHREEADQERILAAALKLQKALAAAVPDLGFVQAKDADGGKSTFKFRLPSGHTYGDTQTGTARGVEGTTSLGRVTVVKLPRFARDEDGSVEDRKLTAALTGANALREALKAYVMNHAAPLTTVRVLAVGHVRASIFYREESDYRGRSVQVPIDEPTDTIGFVMRRGCPREGRRKRFTRPSAVCASCGTTRSCTMTLTPQTSWSMIGRGIHQACSLSTRASRALRCGQPTEQKW